MINQNSSASVFDKKANACFLEESSKDPVGSSSNQSNSPPSLTENSTNLLYYLQVRRHVIVMETFQFKEKRKF